MAANGILISTLLRRFGPHGKWETHTGNIAHSRILMPSLVIFARGKKAAKKQKRTKKDIQREQHREYLKKLEAEKAYKDAIIQVVRKGEPLDPEMLNPARKRERPRLSRQEEEARHSLVKEWSRFRIEQQKVEHIQLRKRLECRDKALRELKKLSRPLYLQAIQLRSDLFPFSPPCPTHTPPLANYEPPEPLEL